MIVWFGGLMFQSAVAAPIVQQEGNIAKTVMSKINKRFVGFIWMSVWTMLVTGVIMMLLNPHFEWLKFQNRWSILLGFKQLIFVLMIFYAYGYARMLEYLGTPSSNGGFNERAELYKHRLEQFRRINILLGLAALFLAVAM